MITKKEAKELMRLTIINYIDGLIKHNCIYNAGTFQTSSGQWNKDIFSEVLKEYRVVGWKIEETPLGFVNFSWDEK